MGGVFRAEEADGFDSAKGEVIRQAFPQIVRKVGHRLERGDPPLVDPICDLFRAIGALILRGQMGGDIFEKKRLN